MNEIKHDDSEQLNDDRLIIRIWPVICALRITEVNDKNTDF